MAASASDLLQKVSIATATTLDAPGYTIGDTSITVASTSTWPSDTGVTFAMDQVDANGDRIEGTYNEYVGVVSSGTSVTSVSHVNGTNQNYTAGVTTRVYIPVTEERENRIVTWGLNHGEQDGTLKAGAVHSAAVLANDVVTTPKILDDAVTAPKVSGLDRSNLTVDSNPYKFSAWKSGAQNLVSGNVTKVLFATENYDTNNNFASSTYTVPIAGFYSIQASSKIGTQAANAYFLMIYVNGVEVIRGPEIIPGYANTFGVSVSETLSLSASDTVEIYAYSGSGTGAISTGQNTSRFSGFLVSRT